MTDFPIFPYFFHKKWRCTFTFYPYDLKALATCNNSNSGLNQEVSPRMRVQYTLTEGKAQREKVVTPPVSDWVEAPE